MEGDVEGVVSKPEGKGAAGEAEMAKWYVYGIFRVLPPPHFSPACFQLPQASMNRFDHD